MADENQQSPIDLDILDQLVKSGKLPKDTMDQFMAKYQHDKLKEQVSPIADKVVDMAKKSGLAPDELAKHLQPFVQQTESSNNPNAVGPVTKSGERAKGLMQLMPGTQSDLQKQLGLSDEEANSPEGNVKMGQKYTEQMIEKYKDPKLALAAYNWGPGNMDRFMKKTGLTSYDQIEKFLPDETRNYVSKIDHGLQKEQGISLADLAAGPQAQQTAAPKEPPTLMARVGDALSGLGVQNAEAEDMPPSPMVPRVPTREELQQYAGQAPVPTPEPTIAPSSPTSPLPSESSPMPQVQGGMATPAPTISAAPNHSVQPLDPTQTPVSPQMQSVQPEAGQSIDPSLQGTQMQDQAPQVDPNQALQAADQSVQSGDPTATLQNLATGEDALQQQRDAAIASGTQGDLLVSQAAIDKANKQADIYHQQAADIADRQAKFQPQMDEVFAKVKSDSDLVTKAKADVDNAKIDPDGFWHNLSTPGKIVFGISMVIAALGSKNGEASKLLDNIIQGDINQQKATIDLKQKKLENAKNAVQEGFNLFHNMKDAVTYTEVLANTKVAAMLGETAAKYEGQAQQGVFLQEQAKRQQMAADATQKLIQSRQNKHAADALKSAADATLSPTQKLFQQAADNDPKRAKNLVLIDGKPMGFATDKTKPIVDKAITGTAEINRLVEEIRDMYKDSGTPILSQENQTVLAGKVASLRSEALGLFGTGGKGFSKEIVNELDSRLPLNLFPGGTMQATGKSIMRLFSSDYLTKKLDEFKSYYNRKAVDQLDSGVPEKAPELRDYITNQRAMLGTDSDLKEKK